MNDQLTLMVSDGKQNSTAFMNILVEAVDDETPHIVGELVAAAAAIFSYASVGGVSGAVRL